LVLATGSRPFVPPITGSEGPGAFVYRTLDDLFAIEAAARKSKRAAVIGGGLLGLEASRALHALGLQTSVIEFAARLMPMQLDARGGHTLRSHIEALGLSVLTDMSTTEILRNDAGAVRALRFSNGSILELDMVVFSAGIRPRDELATACGLTRGTRGGIAIDDQCRTSDPEIFAIGECASWNTQVFGLVGPGYALAKVAAQTIAGVAASFEGADLSTKLKLLGVDVASFGDAFGMSEGARSVCVENEHAGTYKRLVLSADGKTVLGGMLVGDASEYAVLSSMARDASVVAGHPEALLVTQAAGAKAALGASMSETSLVCSCNGVSKGDLCSAVRAGACDFDSRRGSTHAQSLKFCPIPVWLA